METRVLIPKPADSRRTERSKIQNQVVDSTRWDSFSYRDDDIVIATFGKTGTTWVQQIVGQLIFRGAEDVAIGPMSPWIEYRGEPIDDVMKRLTSQCHRRFVKTHLPACAVPVHDSASYIYVARDPRDQIWSAHHHLRNLKSTSLVLAEKNMHNDRKTQRLPDVREYYLSQLDRCMGDPWPYWGHLQSWWDFRSRTNVLLVHFTNLQADLRKEIGRVAHFLGIDVPVTVWPKIMEHVRFDYMKRNADRFLSAASNQLIGGATTLLNRGVDGRWQECLSAEESARCDEVASANLSRECATWLKTGILPAELR